MNVIVLIRHGAYNYHEDPPTLSPEGVAQIELLAEMLYPVTAGQTCALLTSPAPRAKDSAAILGQAFSCEPHVHDVLWSDKDRSVDLEGAFEALMQYASYECVIVVTHYEYTEDLPAVLKERLVDDGLPLPHEGLEKGRAWVYDCVSGYFSPY